MVENMDFNNFMAKTLGGKHKALAAPVLAQATLAPPGTPVRSVRFAPPVHSTPTSQPCSSTRASDSGESVTKLLRKQSLTRQQLNNVLPKRNDHIIKLSKKKPEVENNEKQKKDEENGNTNKDGEE